MKKSFLLLLLIGLGFTTFLKGQQTDREKFLEAVYLMDEKRFSEAIPNLEYLLEKDPDNDNLNFNLGLALANSPQQEKQKDALKLFKKSIDGVDPNYVPFSPKEKNAPVDAFYYYGLALHSALRFDDAINNFKKFQEFITEQHYLYEDVRNRIKMSEYAKEAIKSPRDVEFTNLGGQLNSQYPEYSPAIRIDESAIYFTSRRLRPDSSNRKLIDPIDGMYREDIYVAFNENGVWGEARQLNISTDGNEATLNLSTDGKTLFIYKGDDNNGALFQSKLLADSAGIEKWSEPELLGSNINSSANESHVTIDANGELLYFTSDREGGYGGMDIYFCRRLPNGKWAEAVNIGPRINTKFNEDGVFIHPDGVSLYFSSNGHPSMGGYDIMSSTKTDTGWTKVSNLGYPINSVNNDIFFVTTPDGKRAYFSSSKLDGFGSTDIYMLKLIDAEEIPLTLYRGKFTFVNQNNPPKGAIVTVINNSNGEITGVYSPRQRDGEFSVILEPNNSYHFVYEADDFETYEEDIFVPSGASYQEIYKDIQLQPVQVQEGSNSIMPAALAKANVSGALSTNDTAVSSQKLILENENGDVINEYTTDKKGNFKMDDMDPSSTYVLSLDDDPKASFLVYDLNLKNDQDEVIPYLKKDNKVVIFVPSKYPYEFYGIKANMLAGTIRGANGQPLSGISIRLEDSGYNLIKMLTTDESGSFKFTKLSPDQSYRILLEGELPDDPEITITNEFGEVLTFKKVGEGVYEYVPKKGMQTLDAIDRIKTMLTQNGKPLVGAQVRLEDAQRTVLYEAVTDEQGQFDFANLSMDQYYRLVFEGEVPDDNTLILYDEFGEEMIFKAIGKGVYQYLPPGAPKYGTEMRAVVRLNGEALKGLEITLLDENGKVLDVQTTNDEGEFSFQKLNLDQTYLFKFAKDLPDNAILVITNEYGEELTFMKVREGVYQYIPRPAELPFKSYTLSVKDETNYKETYPSPQELKGVIVYFQKYFPYNATEIDQNNPELRSFINDVANVIEKRGFAQIIINSSASKVPTSTFENNSVLTKKRAYATRQMLEGVLKARGLSENNYNFVDINTLITGPEYKGDAANSRSLYEKHQYVRIFIK